MATDLFGCLSLDELLVDLFGLLCHLHGGLGFLVVLAGHPELGVLLAELGAQEAAEAGKPIWGQGGGEPSLQHWQCQGGKALPEHPRGRGKRGGDQRQGDVNLQGFCRSFSKESRHCRASSGEGLTRVKKAQVVHGYPTAPSGLQGF